MWILVDIEIKFYTLKGTVNNWKCLFFQITFCKDIITEYKIFERAALRIIALSQIGMGLCSPSVSV